MAFSFKRSKAGTADQGDASAVMTGSPELGAKTPASCQLPGFLGNQPVIQQMKTVGAAFVVLLLLIAALVYHDNRESTHGTTYIAAAGEMRMLVAASGQGLFAGAAG
jgi:twitching motility protein PilJ